MKEDQVTVHGGGGGVISVGSESWGNMGLITISSLEDATIRRTTRESNSK